MERTRAPYASGIPLALRFCEGADRVGAVVTPERVDGFVSCGAVARRDGAVELLPQRHGPVAVGLQGYSGLQERDLQEEPAADHLQHHVVGRVQEGLEQLEDQGELFRVREVFM